MVNRFGIGRFTFSKGESRLGLLPMGIDIHFQVHSWYHVIDHASAVPDRAGEDLTAAVRELGLCRLPTPT